MKKNMCIYVCIILEKGNMEGRRQVRFVWYKNKKNGMEKVKWSILDEEDNETSSTTIDDGWLEQYFEEDQLITTGSNMLTIFNSRKEKKMLLSNKNIMHLEEDE